MSEEKPARRGRPPIGVMPEYLWREFCPEPTVGDLVRRYEEVASAVVRYREARCEPLGKWLAELWGSV